MADLELCGISPPRTEAERSGKTDPREIRQQQNSGRQTPATELEQRPPDQNPEHDDIRKRPRPAMPREEQPAPEGIDDELRDKQSQRFPCESKSSVFPHEPSGDSHTRVEDAPHRSEHPSRRSPRRPRQLGIEFPCVHGCHGAHRRRCKREQQPSHQTDQPSGPRETRRSGAGRLRRRCGHISDERRSGSGSQIPW